MRTRSYGMLGGAIALILALLPVAGTAELLPTAPDSRAWQSDGDAYTSPQYGYLVEWNDTWATLERDQTSRRGGADTMTLTNNDGRVRVAGQPDELSAEEVLDETIAEFTDGAEAVDIIDERREGDVLSVEMTADRDHFLIEAQAIDDVVVVVSLRARENDYETALALAREGITLNGTPVFSGEPAGPTEDVPDDPAEDATEEPTEDATEEPGVEETEEPADDLPDTNIDGTSYTSPDHGWSVTWDDEWIAFESASDGDFNDLRLSSDTGAISIVSGSFYDGDPDACLAGEDAYFGTEDPNVTDWQPAVDANGAPITFSGDGIAYGVFTLQYGNEDEGFSDLVDYIECRTLVPGESTLEVFITTTPDLYEENIEAALEITNAIEMPEGSDPVEPADPALPDFDAMDGTPEATPEVEPIATEDATPESSGETGLNGTTFVSPSFGFTLEVPAGWTVEDESVAEGDETLVMGNGVSTVSVHATNAYDGELTGCIGFARDLLVDDPVYADLRLDTTSSGDPFQGADDRSAYALFTYTGEDGEKWAHYIHCEPLVEGESVLIISQDVPYDDYSSERLARRQIQRAIEFP